MAFLEDQTFNFSEASLDAFGKLRVSNPSTRFDAKFLGDDSALFWDDAELSGSGTSSVYNSNSSTIDLFVGSSAGTRVRQTFRRFNYQAGKSQAISMTGVFGATSTGITKRIGYFDEKNGVFFENNEGTINAVVRSFASGVAVDNQIPQASWNKDKMDGTGASGINLDFTKSQIFFIDFEWLAVGTVAFGFVVDRQLIYVHFQHHANDITGVYMSSPNLPLRYEISNDGTGAADSMTQICSTVISEGGEQNTGITLGVTRGTNSLVTNNDSEIYPLISVRLKSNFLSSVVKPESFSIVCTSAATFAWYLVVDPVFSGAMTFNGVNNSSIEADITSDNTRTISGGTILKTGVITQARDDRAGGGAAGIINDFSLGSFADGTPQVFCLAVQRITGTSETFYGALNWLDQK